MRKHVIAALAACLCLACLGQAHAGGRLAVDAAVIEFGTMREGLVSEKVVNLSNTGDAPLVIDNVTTS